MTKYSLLPYRRSDLDLFNEMERDLFSFPAFASACKTDILDEGDHYLLQAEMPGFEKEDIGIAIEGDQLVIRASRDTQKEEKQKKYIHRERVLGTYVRRFDIAGIDVDAISAEYKNGMLHLTLPKREKKPEAGKKIEIL